MHVSRLQLNREGIGGSLSGYQEVVTHSEFETVGILPDQLFYLNKGIYHPHLPPPPP